jgi:hypothetical protein
MAVPQFRGADRILGAVQQLAAHNERERAIEEQKRRERERKRSNQWGVTGGMLGAVAGAYLGGPAGAAAGYGVGSTLGQTLEGSNPPGPEQTIPVALNTAATVDQYNQRQRQQAGEAEIARAMGPQQPPPMIAAPPAQPTVPQDQFGVPQFDQPLQQPPPQISQEQYNAEVQRQQMVGALGKAGYGGAVAAQIAKQMFPSGGERDAQLVTVADASLPGGRGVVPIGQVNGRQTLGIPAATPVYPTPPAGSKQTTVGGRPVSEMGGRWYYTDNPAPLGGTLEQVPLAAAPEKQVGVLDVSGEIPKITYQGVNDKVPANSVLLPDWEIFNAASNQDEPWVAFDANGAPKGTALTFDKATVKAGDGGKVVSREALSAANAPLSADKLASLNDSAAGRASSENIAAQNRGAARVATDLNNDARAAEGRLDREARAGLTEEPNQFGRGDPRGVIANLAKVVDKGGELDTSQIRTLNYAMGEAAKPGFRTDADGNTTFQSGQETWSLLPKKLRDNPEVIRPTVEMQNISGNPIGGAVGAAPKGEEVPGAIATAEPTFTQRPVTPPRPTPKDLSDIGSTQNLSATLKAMRANYTPEGVGPAWGRLIQYKKGLPEIVPGATLTPMQARFMVNESKFRNAWIKSQSGATVTDQEMARNLEQLPALTDQPVIWEAKYDAAVRDNLIEVHGQLARNTAFGLYKDFDYSQKLFHPEEVVREQDKPLGAPGATSNASTPAPVTTDTPVRQDAPDGPTAPVVLPKEPQQYKVEMIDRMPLSQVKELLKKKDIILSLPQPVYEALKARTQVSK